MEFEKALDHLRTDPQYVVGILLVIIVVSSGLYYFVWMDHTEDAEIIVDRVNDNMSSVDTYTLEKALYVKADDGGDTLEGTINESITVDTQLQTFHRIGTRGEAINQDMIEADIEEYNDGSYTYRYDREVEEWVVVDTLTPLGYDNTLEMNPEVYDIEHYEDENKYQLQTALSHENVTSDTLHDIADWTALEVYFANSQNIDEFEVTAKVNSTTYLLESIDIDWKYSDQTVQESGEISYKFREYDTENVFVPEEVQTERGIIESNQSSENELTADFTVQEQDDEIRVDINSLSQSVENIIFDSYVEGEFMVEASEQTTVTLSSGEDYNADTDRIYIILEGDNKRTVVEEVSLGL